MALLKKMMPTVLFFLIFLSCTDVKVNQKHSAEAKKMAKEIDSLKQLLQDKKTEQHLITSLTFQKNDAEQAMNFYISLFENSEILNIQRWGKEGPGKEGSIMQATFLLDGKLFICSDSPPVHDWDFTPAFSNYVECQNEVEFQRFYSKLTENGKIAMPADNYGFSKKFAWVIDSFGVSWQLNLK